MKKGQGFHDRHSPFRFDPATLFIGGAVKGAFYDPSNITTLFQDNAGTTPVTAVEQTVGRILDLSGNANHATQSVLASRPMYRARYNLLTYSEELDQAIWVKGGASITQNATTAPDGTLTADALIENTANAAHFVYQTATILASRHTFSIYAKQGAGARYLAVYPQATSVGWAIFDVTNGVITATGGAAYVSSSIVAVGNGWYRCSVTWGATGTGAFAVCYLSNSSTTPAPAYLGDGTSSVFLWGAQLLSANDVTTTGNAYQRVAAATSYDTSSPVWRPYLALDGSNDSMLTGSIDFTGTNKMTVFAGVTKNVDAAGIIAELSADKNANNGVFIFNTEAAPRWYFASKGTAEASVNSGAIVTFPAPATSVVTTTNDIAAPVTTIRVNGAQLGTNTASQGSGNYGNYPLYIGRRNNASIPFNGRLYGLIVLGAAASSWQVQVTEQWMAGKTGLQF